MNSLTVNLNVWIGFIKRIKAKIENFHIVLNHYLIFIVSLIFLFACQSQIPGFTGKLPINIPNSSIAGTGIMVTIGPINIMDGTKIGLIMMGQHGPKIYKATFEEGIAEFDIPGNDTTQPGYRAFIATLGESRGEAGMLLRPSINHKQRAQTDTIAIVAS